MVSNHGPFQCSYRGPYQELISFLATKRKQCRSLVHKTARLLKYLPQNNLCPSGQTFVYAVCFPIGFGMRRLDRLVDGPGD